MYTKVGRALAAAAAAGALVSGCGSPVQAGSAIIVGDTAVPLEQVQSQVGTLLARVPAEQRQQDTAPTLARDIVTNELLHTLLARAAGRAGHHRDRRRGGRVHRAAGRRGDPPAELGARPRGAALAGARLPRRHRAGPQGGAGPRRHHRPGRRAQPRPTPRPRRARSPRAAPPPTRCSTTRARPAGAWRSPPPPTRRTRAASCSAPRSATSSPTSPTPSRPPGTSSGSPTGAPTPARRGAPATLSLQQLYLIGQRTLQPLADDLAVRVNPRYGVWDQVSLRVVPANQTSGLVLAAGR